MRHGRIYITRYGGMGTYYTMREDLLNIYIYEITC